MTEAERKWNDAKRAWDRDDGKDQVKTVNRGEDLYFAALNLIEELRDELRAAQCTGEVVYDLL